ncbi:hypothetical protein Tco_1376946 [Tanacetum coccineum]
MGLCNKQIPAAYSDLRVLQIGTRAKVIENQSLLGIDDEEISEGGPEDPQTPPVPQDEDEREPMFVQAHDPDYVPEPIYPEYIPLEDEHEFPAEEQPLPPVDSPTAEDGSGDYPMDGGDDGDDDDGDSSGDDADGEDEDEEDEDEEEEEHLAPADSTIVVPVDEPVFPPEGTEPVIPPPSTDITIGARITVWPSRTPISLPPEAEVERLLAMTTPSPSPPISLSPPSVGEHLARIASTQALIDAVTAALPSPSLPPLPPSLYIPPPVDRRDDILESEQPPRKRLCLSTLGSRYEVGESSTARPTRGRGIDYGFISMVDVEERRQGIRDVGYGIRDTWVDPAEAVPEIAPMTVGEVNTRVTELAELHEHDTQDFMLYWRMPGVVGRRNHSDRYGLAASPICLRGKDDSPGESMMRRETHRDHVYAHETHLQAHQTQLQLQSTLIQTQHQTDLGVRPDGKTLRVIRDMRREMSDMQAELLSLREQQRRARQSGPEARIPDHQDASGDADSHI